MNRIDRLLATILLLQGRRCIRAEDIAAHFEISPRTVYRDVAALSEAGVPVVAEAGVGYSLLKGYHVPPVMFTAEEASALFLGGELAGQLTDQSLQAQMRSALLKIRSVLPRDSQDQWERLAQTTALYLAPPHAAQPSPEVLTPIQNALARRRLLSLRYQAAERDEPTQRQVEPMGLVYYADHWHLIAFCRLRQDYRDFRTDRIRKLEVLAQPFVPREGFSVRQHVESWLNEHELIRVKARFAPQAADRARRSWFPGFVEEQRTSAGVELSFLTGSFEWISGWLLSFGTGVEILEPSELRSLLACEAERIARHHQCDEHEENAT